MIDPGATPRVPRTPRWRIKPGGHDGPSGHLGGDRLGCLCGGAEVQVGEPYGRGRGEDGPRGDEGPPRADRGRRRNPVTGEGGSERPRVRWCAARRREAPSQGAPGLDGAHVGEVFDTEERERELAEGVSVRPRLGATAPWPQAMPWAREARRPRVEG
jgi:hypothetical protein